MEVFKVDNRNRSDLLDQIEELARAYTPEWKFDIGNPDAMSVIGIIYANQTLANIKNMNQLMTKYHIEFANMYGVSQKAASAAKTICTFEINENLQQGAELKRGTQVIGINAEGDEMVFALSHDICITNAKLTDIIGISGRNKKLKVYRGDYKIYNYSDGTFVNFLDEDTPSGEIKFFDYSGTNAYRQAVVMKFSKLTEDETAPICLKFSGGLKSEQFARIFSDSRRYEFKYVGDMGTVCFDKVVCNGDLVELTAKEAVKSTVILEKKLSANDNLEEGMPLEKVELFFKNMGDKSLFLWNGKNEVVEDKFLPFSNQPVLYNEFYISHEFLFEQKGASVRIHFKLEFGNFSTKDLAVYEPDLKIIKRKPKNEQSKPHYNCYVQEISFDYFTARGWKHLNTNKDMSVLFSDAQNEGEYDITFEIPRDWESVVVGGYEGNCIRMQIIKADNCYINDVEYCYPIISEFELSIDGEMMGIAPTETAYIHGQTKEKDISRAFGTMEYDGDYMFLGFDKKLPSGPVALFMDLNSAGTSSGVEMEFSYSSQKGFKTLKVIDDTGMLQNSGLIRFIPPADMGEYEVEGEKKYWLRIEGKKGSSPILNDIYLNAAYVENGIELDEQDYYIDTVTAYMKFPLYAQNILSAKVWVNEKEQLSYDEMVRMSQRKDIETRIVYNFMGEIEEFYVLWHEIDDFDDVGDGRRCYIIDRSKNELIFGDGIHSNVPQNTTGIAFKARVKCCDGESANIAPLAIDRFRSSIISVENVTNPIGAYGGTNIENIGDALKRGSNILSSRRRLVSKKDYIREAELFSDTIDEVECVVEGERINLVLLMKDYKKGEFSFRNIKEKLHDHLLECCEVTCGFSDINIVEPVFVDICIDLWLSVQDMSKGLELKQRWHDKITEYLDPKEGGARSSWQIGKLPTTKQIRLMLSTLEGDARTSAQIKNINIMASYSSNGSRYNVSLEKLNYTPFMYCCNGSHNIYINGI